MTAQPAPAPDPSFTHRWLGQPGTTPASPPAWLWSGYLARGRITLLTSVWKAGKTTLTALLLARLKAGGALAGAEVRPGRAIVVSEEDDAEWDQRGQTLDLAGHVCLISRPFRGPPTLAGWLQLLEHMAELHRQHRFDLLVIDPLAPFLPAHAENGVHLVQAALAPLQQGLAAAGVAVLLLHHPRKAVSGPGQKARGTGALAGLADIVLELDYLGSPLNADRRRLLHGYARQTTTPRCRVMELSADGTDYISLGDLAEADFAESWQMLRTVLAAAPHKLTRAEILAAWPPDEPKPTPISLYRWLTRAVAAQQLHRAGTGHKDDAYRYWLPGQEAKWDEQFPLWRMAEQCAAAQRLFPGLRKADEGP